MIRRLLALTALATAAVTGASAAVAASGPQPLTATLETPPLFEADNADADDPAIWVNPEDEDDSLVITTAKEAGMNVYDLDGELTQHIDPRPAPSPDDNPGRYNNVDLLDDFALDGDRTDLAVASDRGLDTLGVFAIDPDSGELTDVSDPDMKPIFSQDQGDVNDAHTAYGLTTWSDKTGAYALVSRNAETDVALLRLTETDAGTVGYQTVRMLQLPREFTMPNGASWAPCDDPGEYPQVEGMTVDKTRGVAYLGQEQVGIWRVSADLTGEPELIDTAVEYGLPGEYDPATEECSYGDNPGYGGEVLRTDIEGLTIYHHERGKGYLLASSQGDDSFAVYSISGGNDYLGSFSIADGSKTDGTQHSDGADVVNTEVGDFEAGLLVVQDGDNTPEGSDESSTNFKFVDWEDVVNHSGVKGLRSTGD